MHAYKFTNTLLNHDSLRNFYSSQNVVGSGRWFLSIACGISSYFDLPWVIGLLSILYIALTTIVIVELFKIQNPVVIVLTGAFMVTFPSITATFQFGYTADGYMLAMLMSALAVYVTRLGKKQFWRFGLGALLICLACAIYQASVSFALVLLLCYLMVNLLENKWKTKEYLLYIAKQVALFVVALGAYYGIWKICMAIQGAEVNVYMGIEEVKDAGNLSFTMLHGALNTAKSMILFFLEQDVFEHGLTFYGVLSIWFLISLAVILVAAVIKSGLWRRKVPMCLLLLCLLACIPCVFMWSFVSSGVSYGLRMLQSLCVFYIFAAVLYNRWAKMKWSNLAGLLFAVIVLNNAITANISYYFMNQSYEKSYAVGVEMVSRIHQTESEYNISTIAIIGNVRSSVLLGEDEPSIHAPLKSISMLKKHLLFKQEYIELLI